MFDLGDTVTLQWTTLQGAPGSGPVVLTLTLPDGTSATPTVTVPVSGTWSATYLTTQAGRFGARWTSAASAFTDAFDVDEAAPTGLVSLQDVRDQLKFTSTASDEQLRLFIDAATDFIESRVGLVVRRTITSPPVWPTGSGVIFVQPPVISLTSVNAAYGYTSQPYDVSTMYVDNATGLIRYGPYSQTFAFPVTVTYVGGRPIVPPGIRMAALDYIAWLWESQRGPSGQPFQAPDEFVVQAPATVPYKILQALEPYCVPAIA